MFGASKKVPIVKPSRAVFLEALPQALSGYITGPMTKIEGGCNPRVFVALFTIIQAQRHFGVAPKRVAEIGVRDGKFFIGMMKLAEADATGLAIDLFDQQQHNIDGSGWRPPNHGTPFFENVRHHVASAERVTAKAANSLNLSLSEIQTISLQHGPFDLFSIDGGHEAEHVTNDLFVAEMTLSHSGIVLLDDYYNPNFPGVHEGFGAYMLQKRRLVPLMYSTGKLFLCNKTYHQKYREFMGTRTKHLVKFVNYLRKTKLYGYEVLNVVI